MKAPSTIKIQPVITTDTHKILRTRAAELQISFGKVIDQWAIMFKRSGVQDGRA